MRFVYQYLVPVFAIGLIFFLLRTFSVKVFSFVALDDLTHLIYLPAGIRLLAVAIYGWLGIVGIILGWVFCHLLSDEKTFLESLMLGFISGLTAYTAFRVWQVWFKINNALEGLNSRLAIFLVLISAGLSAVVRYLYLNSIDPLTPFLPVFLVGLIGDILGAFAVLYLIKGLLYITRRYRTY